MKHLDRLFLRALAPTTAVLLALALPCAAQRGPGGGPEAERETEIAERFDVDADGVLDAGERAAARAWLAANPPQRGGPGGRGPGGDGRGGRGFPGGQPEAAADPRAPRRVTPEQVAVHPDQELYDPAALRTIFLTFPTDDWFDECAALYRTDVEVPATMLVDGVVYPDVGVGFRGNSSYIGVRGRKRSFAISVDARHGDQRLLGYRTLNLLNSHSDPSFLREVIQARIARQIMPAMKANLVQLVVNGESFGVFVNVQQFNRDFLRDEFGTKGGVRWKAPAGPQGSGLRYQGEERAAYERGYQLKTDVDDQDAAFDDLIALCRVLEQTSDADLERELPTVLDIDATLRFLAIDAVLLDGDGYTSRASDFVLWQDPDGRFRPLPYDSNEILGGGGPPRGRGGFPPDGGPPPGRGGRRGPGGGPGGMRPAASPTSSPLLLTEVEDRPLARLLSVPLWRAQFLAYVHALAVDGLDWDALGPFLSELHDHADALVRDDEKALYGYDAFAQSLDGLREIVATRRTALLEHESLQGPWPEIVAVEPGTSRVEEGRSALQVRATVKGDVARVLLHVAERRRGPFVAIPMYDDGAHDDGEALDGVFAARAADFDTDETLWIHVEARSEADGGAVTFSPPGGSSRPMRVGSD